MPNIRETVTKALHGETLGDQIAAKKSKPLTDDERSIVESDDLTVKMAAASLHPGIAVDAGAKLVDGMEIAAKALAVTTKGRTSRVTQAELDAEAGHPNPQGAEAIAAIQRINRRGEPK
jgi:hypothetical protein